MIINDEFDYVLYSLYHIKPCSTLNMPYREDTRLDMLTACSNKLIVVFYHHVCLTMFIQLRQAMEWFGFGALGIPPPHIPLVGFKFTTMVGGVASVTTSGLVGMKLM